jgi:thiamine-monophosphate kinase
VDEFALIDALIEELGEQATGAALLLGPGDDAALIEPVAGQVIASSIDGLVSGVHFPTRAAPDLIGYRSLAVSVSDLAAMGADPLYCMLALTLPSGDVDWLRAFARGVAAASFAFRCPVAGGNLARGPLTVSVSVHGQVPFASALRRGGASAGDHVLVSGRLGAAACALTDSTLAELGGLDAARRRLADDPYDPLARYYLPTPRLELGRALRGIASAAIDLSDGLVADVGHVCRASGCGAEIDVARVPAAPGATHAQSLAGGDDYELLVAVPPAQLRAAQDVAAAVGVVLTDIGKFVNAHGLTLLQGGERFQPSSDPAGGFRHFR